MCVRCTSDMRCMILRTCAHVFVFIYDATSLRLGAVAPRTCRGFYNADYTPYRMCVCVLALLFRCFDNNIGSNPHRLTHKHTHKHLCPEAFAPETFRGTTRRRCTVPYLACMICVREVWCTGARSPIGSNPECVCRTQRHVRFVPA